MRLWRCARGLVLERRPAASGVLGSLLTVTRRGWPEPPADYWLVDEHGGVIERFTVLTWTIEDELGATLFAVEDRALLRIDVREVHGRDATVAERVVLAGLEETDDVAAIACARASLESARALAAEQNRQGEARVAAIPGANDEHGAGDDFRAAQSALRERVAAYGEPLSEALLGALVRFGALYDSAPCVEPALDAFVAACRLAAFDRTVPRDTAWSQKLDGMAWWKPGDRAKAAELALHLRDLERMLEREADDQERIDALANSAVFSAAAGGVGHARALLEALERASLG